MPAPFTPPFVSFLQDLLNEIQAQTTAIQSMESSINNLEATVAAQADDLIKLANFQRYQLESFYGANADISGMWDGTDRYV